ncbi:Lsr2 protein [Geodermatophilus siccatus]|uniref:Lsr2 protein n=1 Tax=Geodermatophilus siccatus TaxID=1137991 RepID=A0A1G9V3D2_9ACTN|nr:Lsr2 family protein [Geodermatophilus siccatus]SDM66335.1 Lsr2 protein [Geodermatophilus siccatus]
MATKTSVVLVDDLTDEAADTTVRFGLDGRDYEIDLTEANASELREVLSRYVKAARKLSKSGRPVTRTQSKVDPAAVRAWAKANGIEVNERGRIKAEVVEQYRAAGN